MSWHLDASSPQPPDPQNSEIWSAYWAGRQAALGLDFHGDIVQPHEIETYERLLRIGEQPAPIWNDPSRPTNDFEWLNRDARPIEVKQGRPDPRKVMSPVLKAVIRAQTHAWAPTAKEHFLLDFGTDQLSADVRRAMRSYNTGRLRYRITSLWVLHSAGELEEIDLDPP